MSNVKIVTLPCGLKIRDARSIHCEIAVMSGIETLVSFRDNRFVANLSFGAVSQGEIEKVERMVRWARVHLNQANAWLLGELEPESVEDWEP